MTRRDKQKNSSSGVLKAGQILRPATAAAAGSRLIYRFRPPCMRCRCPGRSRERGEVLHESAHRGTEVRHQQQQPQSPEHGKPLKRRWERLAVERHRTSIHQLPQGRRSHGCLRGEKGKRLEATSAEDDPAESVRTTPKGYSGHSAVHMRHRKVRTDWPDTAITLQRLASTYMSVPKKSKHVSPHTVHKSPKQQGETQSCSHEAQKRRELSNLSGRRPSRIGKFETYIDGFDRPAKLSRV